MDNNRIHGHDITELRRRLRWSREQLAAVLRVNPWTVKTWESDQYHPNTENAHLVRTLMDVVNGHRIEFPGHES